MFDVIETCGLRGAISDDVRAALPGLPYSSVTARYKSLAEKVMIKYSGDKRQGQSGRGQRVMIAANLA